MEYRTVTNFEELEEAKKNKEIFVKAICPKCGCDWTSLLSNAKEILTKKSCLVCGEKMIEKMIEVYWKSKLQYTASLNSHDGQELKRQLDYLINLHGEKCLYSYNLKSVWKGD